MCEEMETKNPRVLIVWADPLEDIRLEYTNLVRVYSFLINFKSV